MFAKLLQMTVQETFEKVIVPIGCAAIGAWALVRAAEAGARAAEFTAKLAHPEPPKPPVAS